MVNEELRNRRVLDRFLDQSEWAGRLYPEQPRDASGNLLPLTDEQQAVMKLVVEDEQNVFFAGPAGSGKSMLLRELIAALEEKYPTRPNRVQVCVLTGLVKEQAWGKNLEEARVVVLDRTSMMRPGDFVQLERDARRIRKNDRPFGGLQIVATGDFAQQLRDPNPNCEEPAPEMSLSHVFRQKDPDLVRMLNETREGRVSKRTIATLERLNRPLIKWHGLEPTALSSSPEEVNEVNRTRMDRLQGKGYTYRALSYHGQDFTRAQNRLFRQCIISNWLQLKLQAQVMLIKNLSDPRLTIGTIGKVISFHPTGQGDIPRPKVRFVLLDGSTVDHICTEETWKADCYVPGQGHQIIASKTQIPLVPAWALTVSAAQGLTLPRVKVDLAQTFKEGELYAALPKAARAR
ncbi:ATP-dependent DNA helicase PIF1 [Lasiodiplodia hormozganensis]|uniref:ATP-dependent DNA helicase n=1 Tax=Lasiodiplodia hormozganensis TaxID=869390 RepID=A0AA39WG77_9PEZI|nr:ATP-dependent DNA helicase PIF1 [Lasiodiplodia hormozganensis]